MIATGVGRKQCCGERRGSSDLDPTIADAILDRLVHAAQRITLKGESLRKKDKA